jgi:hypothetical protein
MVIYGIGIGCNSLESLTAENFVSFEFCRVYFAEYSSSFDATRSIDWMRSQPYCANSPVIKEHLLPVLIAMNFTRVSHSRWATVTTVDDSSVAAKAVAAMRWWTQEDKLHAIKGNLLLQKKEQDNAQFFRIAYDGKCALTGEDRLGGVMLPSEVEWVIDLRKAKSKNTKARLDNLTFKRNSSNIKRIQITIPFEGSGAVEKTFGEAIVFSDQELRQLRSKDETPRVGNKRMKTTAPAPKKANKQGNKQK